MLVLRLFSEIAMLHRVAVFACLWKEVSSGFSSSAILIWSVSMFLINIFLNYILLKGHRKISDNIKHNVYVSNTSDLWAGKTNQTK